MVNVNFVKFQLVKESGRRYAGESKLMSPKVSAEFLRDFVHLDSEPEEVLVLLGLNTKNKVIAVAEVSRGSLNSSIVHPREIFKRAITMNANSIIIAHNHPSGEASPSLEDGLVTSRLQEAGKLLGIELLDHIIIGEDGEYHSFKEEGRL